MHWLIDGRPAPVKLIKDNLDPTDGLMSFTETRRTPFSSQSEYITSNSSLSSTLPFKAQQQSTASDDLSAVHEINPLPLQSHSYSSEITNNKLEKLMISQDVRSEAERRVNRIELQTDELERAKKAHLMSSLTDNTIVTNAQMHTNGIINRRGIRKGLITSSLMVGAVQRKDVDTVYTCLASNSNMTQASRASIKLQMNRK